MVMTRAEGEAMRREQEVRSAPRRDFLRLAGLGGVAAAGAAVLAGGGGARQAEAAAAVTEQPGGRTGYRETAHVKRFYELARF
jgi:hypothetical protein